MRSSGQPLALLSLTTALAACGGNVAVDGTRGAGGSSTTIATTTGTGTGGQGPCQSTCNGTITYAEPLCSGSGAAAAAAFAALKSCAGSSPACTTACASLLDGGGPSGPCSVCLGEGVCVSEYSSCLQE